MARVNTVPLGQAGTGAAYYLPDSKALDGLIQNIDYNRKMGLLNIKARSDYNSQTNKDFLDNKLKVKQGVLFQDDLNNATQQWVDKGAKYRARGFNPYQPNSNNPAEVKAATEFLNEKSKIEGMADIRDIHQKNFLQQQREYEKGGIDEDSWSALNNYYKNTKLADIYETGAEAPQLMKAFDAQTFMKNIAAPTIKSNTIENGIDRTTVAPNVAAIRNNVEQAIAQTPQAERFFNKRFNIDPTSAPLKTLIGSTDPKEIDATIDQYYKTDPEGIKEVLKMFPEGTTPSTSSPVYQKFKKEQIAKQLSQEARKDAAIESLANQRAGSLNSADTYDYNFKLEDQSYQRENQGYTRRRMAYADENQEYTRGQRKQKEDVTNQRDQLIQGLQVGNREQVQTLRQLVRAKGGVVSFDQDGTMQIKIDRKVDGQTKKVTIPIDMSEKNDEGYVALNEVLNEVAGKKVPIETLKGKPAYAGGLVDVGEASITKPQIEQLRSTFGQDYKSLGLSLINKGLYKTKTEAFKAAAEILDPKGRVHKVK